MKSNESHNFFGETLRFSKVFHPTSRRKIQQGVSTPGSHAWRDRAGSLTPSDRFLEGGMAIRGNMIGQSESSTKPAYDMLLTKIKALEASLASFILEESDSLEASPMQLRQLQPALEVPRVNNGGGMRSIRNIAKPHYYIVDGDSVELIDRDSLVESTVSHSVEHASSDDESS
eukprot:scaffold22131_cov283-Skeletonema_marinoi.AAC.3